MEDKNVVQRGEGKEEAISPEVVCPAKTISELATQLEDGIVPAAYVKRIGKARGVALFFASIEYDNAHIAALLHVTLRQVQRYFGKNREDAALALGPDFQKEILGKILRRCNARRQRLTRLSCAKGLSAPDIARMEFMCEQIDMNMATLLDKYGYISKEQAKIDIDRAAEARKIEDEMRHRDMFIKLSKSQQQQIEAVITAHAEGSIKQEQEIYKRLDEMYFGFVEENKKVQSLDDVLNKNSNPPDKAITN